MFGGEWLDSEHDKMHVYADLYVFNADKLTWRRVVSPGGPQPRTSHQAVVTRHHMYVFGGEFTSLNQEKFRHYGDLWRLDLADWRWEQLPSRGGPSPRSGHRMALHKGRLLLFGGFFDAGRETRYFNDLWAFGLEDLKWAPLGPRPGSPAPAPRGGCQLALHPEGGSLYMIGGFSVRKALPDPAPAPAGGAKRARAEADEGKAVVHDDVWRLDLASLQWERVKKAGMAPTPRTSFGLAVHKARAVVFGGVHDREGAGDRLYSELYNDAYQFSFSTQRWFPLAVRPAKKDKLVDAAAAGAAAGAAATGAPAPTAALPPGVSPEMHAVLLRMAADKDSPLHRAATRIQAAFRGHAVRKAFTAYRLGGAVSELLYSPATFGLDLSAVDQIRPRARSAPSLAVLRGTLWMWGGTVEVAHTDVVLDDLWALDLNKLDGWRCVKENSAGEEAFRELSDESDSEEEGWEASSQ
jgi:hypothetical protein